VRTQQTKDESPLLRARYNRPTPCNQAEPFTVTIPTSFPCALTIAGSDSGGGAGIQADLKTFAALGIHGLSALTALTAQHTRGVVDIHLPPLSFLQAQIDACFDDFNIMAVKIGMLASIEIIDLVKQSLEKHRPKYIVLDPVMIASSGAKLLDDNAVQHLNDRLLGLATVLTPNIPEAELLLGHKISTSADALTAATRLSTSGAHAVLLKGGHLEGGEHVIDLYYDGDIASKPRPSPPIQFAHPRLPVSAHGTGCTLSSAIAAYLCHGLSVQDACKNATDYVARALQDGYCPGHSQITVLNHSGKV